MRKGKKSYQVVSLDRRDTGLDPKILLRRVKSSLQLPLTPLRRQPRQKKNLPLTSQKINSSNPQQTKKYPGQPQRLIFP